MKTLHFVAVAAGLAVHVDYSIAAPMGVIVVTSGSRLAIPAGAADANDAVDPLAPYRFSPKFVAPHGEMPKGELSAWWNPTMPGPRIDLHPQKTGLKVGCGHKGRKASVAHSFRHIVNKLRAALGLPIANHYDNSELPNTRRYRLKFAEDGSRVVEVDTPSFFTRFEYAMRSLSPRESWAVTFVLGCGLGALLRMIVVLAVIFIRGRRGGRRGGRRCLRTRCCRRDNAEASALSAEAAPPAYADNVDEKSQVVSAIEASGLTTAEVPKKLEDDVEEITTVERTKDQTLMVFWKHVDGSEHVSTSSEIHEKCPGKLFEFYEANLKWRPNEEEGEAK